jgi:hypothetical protein
MVAVMCRVPNCTADVAKLVSATAGHVIAALIFLNYKPTFFTLAVMQVVLEEFHFMFITRTLMPSQ